jgi:ABC-2 type transport system permease protein
MLRYLKVYVALFRAALKSNLVYTYGFIIEAILVIVWQGMMLVFYIAAFNQVQLVAGWNRDEVILLLGCYLLVMSVPDLLFRGGLKQFSTLVNRGMLDLILIKPIDTQFYISLWWVKVQRVFEAIAAVVLIGIQLARLGIHPWLGSILGFVFLCITGSAAVYALSLTIVTFALYANRLDNVAEMYYPLRQFGRVPVQAYPRILSLLFMTFLPVGLMASVPAKHFISGFSLEALVMAGLVALGVCILSSAFFRYSLKRYWSASS